MDVHALERIERMNYILGALMVALASVLTTPHFLMGIAFGVVISCVNFSIIRRLVSKLVAIAPEKRGTTAFFFVPKMTGLLVVVSLAIYFLPISPIGMGIGFSVFLLSIMVESIRFMTDTTLTS